jgi:folate-binding Fe-S cluster repair protein YgfZ
MIMVLNEILTRQNVFTKLVLNDGEKELPKALKVKIMRIRMAYAKIKKSFDEEVQEFTKELVPQELRDLNDKQDRTDADNARLEELTNKANSEYQEFLIQKGLEEISDVIDDSFTMDEYSDIVDVNSGNDIEINGNKINAADFLEIIYDLFVKE